MQKFALISVTDKTGIVELVRALSECGYRILSTGGTANILRSAGLQVVEVSEHTGSAEMLDGRVKTLHPAIHGGILFRREIPTHVEQVHQAGIWPIDFVIVNLYPFEKVIKTQTNELEKCIENIDIGGPALIRSAAKNYNSVTVICDPSDYGETIQQLKTNGSTTKDFRERMAVKAFRQTAYYDSIISNYLVQSVINDLQGKQEEQDFPDILTWPMRKAASLRYGENPHQRAALYGDFLREFTQLQGKELSYNNILDTAAALDLIFEFDEPTLGILKHTNPCGVGQGSTMLEAWEKAFATDREAPFGGIIVMNRPCEGDLAKTISEIFAEVVIAPEFDSDAREIFAKKKNLRLLEIKSGKKHFIRNKVIRSVRSGWLVQDADQKQTTVEKWTCVTEREPTRDELSALVFAWKVVKHVKSNAIVFATVGQTLGIGAGQMSRVDASRIAVWKAAQAGLSLKESVVASDAFFPFPDGVVAAAQAGATAIVQPGGSIRDQEVINTCNERGLTMVFTNTRHFKH